MKPETTPKSVEISNSEGQITILWDDGHTSVYSLYGLRRNCPCVECRGGHGKMDSYDRSYFFIDPPRSYEIDRIRQIGNHAIRIYWSDGHSNGMYQWETLRNLCPCDQCYKKGDD